MYPIGVIGNFLSNDFTPRWEHKEQYKIFTDDPWEIIIHPSLRIELSVSGRMDRRIAKIIQKQQTEAGPKVSFKKRHIFAATIEEIRRRYMLVSFVKDGELQAGYISMNRLGIEGVKEGDLDTYFIVGETVNAVVTGYNEEVGNWYMRVT